MTDSNFHAAAQALREARQHARPIPPISATYGIEGLDAAYGIASLNIADRLASGGRRIVGRKVGLTSHAVQAQLGVDQPDFGVLLDDMEFLDGDEIPSQRLMQPKIEAEIAFVLGRDIGDRVPSFGEFLYSLSHALPALEIVDSAIADWRISLVDTVADNASCGVYVLGNQPLAIDTVGLDRVGMQLHVNDRLVSVGVGAACLGHPLRAAFWLARTLAGRGEMMRAGEVILSGALGPMAAIRPGDAVKAVIGDLGEVSCRIGPQSGSRVGAGHSHL
jgi:2-keto-4-pentenoate hydratase